MEEQGSSIQPFFNILLFFLFMTILIFNINRFGSRKFNSPPSPFKLPLIGNLHQLGSLPHQSLHSLAQKHGPLMLLHLGQVPTLVVSSASAAREILKTHDLAFSNRPISWIKKRILYGKDMAFSPYNEYWRQVRRICIQQLLSANKVQLFRSVIEEEVALMIEQIDEHISSSSLAPSSPTTVSLSEMLFFLTINVICRITTGRKRSEREILNIIEEFEYLLGVLDVGSLIPSLAWVNYINGLNARVEKYFKKQDRFLNDIVEEHIEKRKNKRTMVGGARNAEEEEEEDFVDVLLNIEEDNSLEVQLGKDGIKALIVDMFTAGTDTTYAVPEWAMAELIKKPEIMKEVQEEVKGITNGKPIVTEEDTEKMLYLKSVIKETLRLHPPGPLLLPHESNQDIKIQGYDIRAKTTVIFNAWAIGRDPQSWEEPEKFNPKRFMNINNNGAFDFKGQDFRSIPFGAGRRACPGSTFAITVIEIVLANLLNRFEWAMPCGMNGKDLDMAESPGLTVHRKDNLVLAVQPNYSL